MLGDGLVPRVMMRLNRPHESPRTVRHLIVTSALLATAGCAKSLTPDVVDQFRARSLYTCCNIHYAGEDISDANYYVGSTLPLGTPAQVQDAGRGYVALRADGRIFKLYHQYGREQESFRQYLDKILLSEDPKTKLASFPPDVQKAIENSRVEVGMTKEQVLMSLGYPPTHRTPSTSSNRWTYWYYHWDHYRVVFDDTGKVSRIVGTSAPTRNQPVEAEAAPAPVKAVPETGEDGALRRERAPLSLARMTTAPRCRR